MYMSDSYSSACYTVSDGRSITDRGMNSAITTAPLRQFFMLYLPSEPTLAAANSRCLQFACVLFGIRFASFFLGSVLSSLDGCFTELSFLPCVVISPDCVSVVCFSFRFVLLFLICFSFGLLNVYAMYILLISYAVKTQSTTRSVFGVIFVHLAVNAFYGQSPLCVLSKH